MNIDKSNLITVGIPFSSKVNHEHFEKALSSILNQTIRPNIVHLIQDGDTPQGLNILIHKYMDEFPGLIKIITLPKRGLPYALNQSIIESDTKYYARMDSDDIAFENRLEKQIDYLEENSDVDVLGTWAIEFSDELDNNNGFVSKRPINYNKIKDYFHYRSAFIHPTVVFRSSLFDEIGYYNEKFLNAQDIELCARILRKNIKISNIQEPLLYYRVKGLQGRRSNFGAVKWQILAKYSYNTISIKLNILKILSILFRFLPYKIKKWAYKGLR